jgi:glycosyltransferase involved in cell wall biosynthesis
MASGCPVVATDVGGVADVTGHGDYARLVPQRDASAIASAVCGLLADRDLHARTRDRGIREMRARFDHQHIHESYAQIIKRMAA